MKFIIIFSLVIVSGCTTLSKDVQLVTKGSDTSEVVVFREGAFHAGGVSLYVGKNDKYFLKLRNDQYGKFTINAGKYTLQAKADASPASELGVNLSSGDTVCLKGEPNPDSLAAIIIPFAGNMIPTFILKEVDCPSQDELSGYVNVKNS